MFGNEKFSPELLTSIGAGLLSGNTWNQQLANASLGANSAIATQKQQQALDATKNKTIQMLMAQSPELAQAVQAGILSPNDAFGQMLKNQQEAAKAARPDYSTQVINGRLVRVDKNTGKVDELGNFQDSNANIPAVAKENKYWSMNPDEYTTYRQRLQDEQKLKSSQNDQFEERKRAAISSGLKEGDPAFQTYILTGKMPRKDQQALTAVDKKAILDADEMVQINTSAIDSLKKAKDLSASANAGFSSGLRATLGANLPDWMVPDQVSSPDSSEATQNFDNAIVGQALTQLKAIFGGAPTEGERAILLQLQGSSNLQPAVREAIIDRAIQAAERRLQFNKERSDSLRGGTFYKSQVPSAANTIQPNLAQPNIGVTKSGVKFSVEQPQ